MSLRIRRGTEAQRTGATFDLGEVAWTTDTNKLYVGDGVNPGGKNILASSAGTGLVWNATTQRLDFNGLGTGIINVQADTNPSLGGNLNLNNRNITGTGNITIDGSISALGTLSATSGLGANLALNSNNITGIGNINIAGEITATQFVGNFNTTGGTSIINGVTRAATLSRINLDTNGSISSPAILVQSAAVSFITNTISASAPYINFYTASSTNAQTGAIGLVRSRGTTISPAVVVNGDQIGAIVASAFSGSEFTLSAEIVSVVDGTVSAGVVPSKMDLKVTNASGITATSMSVRPTQVEFAVPPKLPVIADDAERTTVITAPTKGMLILMTAGTTPAAVNKVQVWDGTAWVNLH
jgi:hypothetical protein